jgi:hypothetical protein
MAISICFNPMPFRVFEADGDFAAGAKGYFYLARTSTPLTVYTDAPLATPHTWPVLADAFGLFAPIYIAKGTEYKVRIEDQAGNILYAADSIDNPGLPTGGEGGGEGGGGGLVITEAQIAQTGDFTWQPSLLDRPGWVKANGKTISSTLGTGATANDDCEALFAFLWNGFSTYDVCPVTPGGRGLTASADWLAAKSIATLDMRGRGAAGLDDMGAAAANLIQISTTATTTSGNPVIVVANMTGVCVGMFVSGGNLPALTKVIGLGSFGGNNVTTSANATASGTAVPVRFSMFADAVVPGMPGGENTHTQLVAELAIHTHDTVNLWGVGTTLNADISGTPGVALEIKAGTTASGLSHAMNIWTPTRLGTWWIKK